jgi:hypothetical protein
MMGLPPGEILLAIAVGASVEALVFAFGSDLIWGLVLSHLSPGVALALAISFICLLVIVMFLRGTGKDQG